jgi:hypothetical protein
MTFYGREDDDVLFSVVTPWWLVDRQKRFVEAVPWVRQLVAGLSPPRPRFAPGQSM